MKQLPVLQPSSYDKTDIEFVCPRVVELTYTSEDLRQFAEEVWDCAKLSPSNSKRHPFVWDEDRRAELRAELDAYYAHLYGFTRDELRYILDPKEVFGEDFPSETFRVLKEREEKEYGEYRTQRLVLEAFDKLAESPRFRDEMSKRVSAFELPTKQPTAVH